MSNTSDYEIIDVVWEKHGFRFQIVRIPEADVDDKLVQANNATGLICRMEYQEFLFSKCVVDLDRVWRFIAESSGGDPDKALELRNELEDLVVYINPSFDPEDIVINRNGVLRRGVDVDGTLLVENPDWGKVMPDSNPYIWSFVSDEEDDSEEETDDKDSDQDEEIDMDDSDSGTVTKLWERPRLEIQIVRYKESDIPKIFSDKSSFQKEIDYKKYICSRCVVTYEPIMSLTEVMRFGPEYTEVMRVEELYNFSVGVNPFLNYEVIDLSKLVKPPRATPSVAVTKKQSKKEKEQKTFDNVPREQILSLGDRMKSKIVGQDHAVDQIVESIQIASCGLRGDDKPIAVYLLLGQTGSGKTFTAKTLAEELIGSKDNLIRVDCSEYTQAHDVMKLTGAPPSYVGHDDGGYLTNAVQEKPFSVVLFDEIEKGHRRLYDVLLQIMDDARLTDGKGNTADFKNTIILLTSNVGVENIKAIKGTIGFGDADKLTDLKRNQAIDKAMKNHFKPEFINRLDNVVSFNTLSEADIYKIVDLALSGVEKKLFNKGIEIKFGDSVRKMLQYQGFSKEFGARPLNRLVEKKVIHPIAKAMLNETMPSENIVVEWVGEELTIVAAPRRIRQLTSNNSN